MAVFSKFKYKEFIKSVLDKNLPKDDIDHFLAALKKKDVAPQEAKDPQGQGNNDGEKESTPQEAKDPQGQGNNDGEKESTPQEAKDPQGQGNNDGEKESTLQEAKDPQGQGNNDGEKESTPQEAKDPQGQGNNDGEKESTPQEAKDPQGQGNNDGEKESTPQETAKPTKKKKAKEPDEMDFVVIHQNIGVILIEVKGGEKFVKSVYSKAKSQIQFGEKFIRGIGELLLPDVRIPVFKVIAMPKVPLHRASECEKYIDLRSEHLRSFKSWWDEHFEKGEFREGILKLTAILLGQRTDIAATAAKILTKVSKSIARQNFLHYNFIKQNKPKVKQGPTRILKPAKGTALAEHFAYLNPTIWDGSCQQIFCGPSGSGKTILLQLKALECIKKQEPVIIFVPRPLDCLYREFFKQNEVSSSMYSIVCTQEELIKRTRPKSHIFVDEFQVFCDGVRLIAIPAVEFIGETQDDRFYKWISYDARQMRTIDNLSLVSGVRMLTEKYGFKHTYLATVVRYTLEITEFIEKHVMKYYYLKPSSDALKARSWWKRNEPDPE